MKKLLIASLVAATTAVFINPLLAAGDAQAGKAKSASCAGCHGTDGNSITPNFPNLAGQGKAYLFKQINDFKVGKRKDPSMAAMVMGLSNQDMHDLSAYYSSQKLKGGEADPELVERGKIIYKGGIKSADVPACMSCHGPTGSGIPGSIYPQLSSQHASYTEKQLKDFRTAYQNPNQETNPLGRQNDSSAIMRSAADKLNDYDIKAVSQYIQGLQP